VSARSTFDDGPAVTPYRPGGAVSGEPSGKLSSNESHLGPGPAVIAAIEAIAPGVHIYRTSDGLREAIAARMGLDVERVIVTNGSDEVCYLIAAALVEAGDRVVLSDPPYRINEIVSVLNGGELARIPIRDGAHDLDALATAAQDAKLVWLPTPHNPTGVALSPEALEDFLAAVPSRCWVVLDEAYRAFLPRKQRPDAGRLLARYPNLVVQRTLSKSAGLAGLRVGFALGSADLIGSLERLRAPFNVNAVALVAAEAALEHPAWGEYAVTQVLRQRGEFEAFLAEIGIEFWPSQTNFVSLVPRDLQAASAALGRRGIAVRDGADLGMPGWIRVTIGSAPRMRLVRESLIETEEMK
jgi:histidinol-phosphate aminotransferase